MYALCNFSLWLQEFTKWWLIECIPKDSLLGRPCTWLLINTYDSPANLHSKILRLRVRVDSSDNSVVIIAHTHRCIFKNHGLWTMLGKWYSCIWYSTPLCKFNLSWTWPWILPTDSCRPAQRLIFQNIHERNNLYRFRKTTWHDIDNMIHKIEEYA